jgi:hypothetical protein
MVVAVGTSVDVGGGIVAVETGVVVAAFVGFFVTVTGGGETTIVADVCVACAVGDSTMVGKVGMGVVDVALGSRTINSEIMS